MHKMPSDFCCAFGCSEFRGRKSKESNNEDISFHRFPIKNKNMLKKWILAIRRDNWEPTNSTKVCSKHFTSDCFETSGWSSRRSLKKDAIPTIFNFSDNCVTPLKDRRKSLKQELQQCEIVSKDFVVLQINTTNERINTSLTSTSTSCTSPKYENNNIKNEDSNEEEMDELMKQPFVENEITGASPKYENNNTKNEESNEEEMNELMEQPFVEIEITGDLPESECLEEDCRYEENDESNLCRFCTKPVGEDCKDVFSGDDEIVKIQEMINVILPGQVHEEDGLPHYICGVCINKWKECYETVLTFFAAEAFFRSLDTHDIVLQDQLVFSDCEIESPEVLLETDLETEECNENSIPIYDWQNKIKIKSSAAEIPESDNKCNVNQNYCTLCCTKFLSIEDLALHRETEHSSASNINQLYCCIKCSMVFKKENALQLHIKSNHPVEKVEFPCEDCPKIFNFKHLLIHHRKLKHKKHICKICGEAFYYLKTLDRHMSVHNDSIKCSTCNKEFKNAYWRRVHEKSHTIDNNHLCWICGKFFQIKSSLDAHLHSHNGLKMTPYKCNICDKEYFSISGINKHKLIHKERVRSFKCSKCEKNFFTNESLKQHFSSHSNIKPFVCHCGVAFKRRSNLYNHKKRHLLQQNSNKPRRPVEINKDTEVFTCSLCGKEIVSKLRFKYHLGKHTGNKKPFDCETCGSVFGNLTNYKNHINIHSSELTFVCETCGLGFRTGRMLKQHKLIHEEERPYACPTCPVSFKRLYSLKEHKIVHSGLRPYECTLCRRFFARKSDCRKHVKRTHAISVQQIDTYIHNIIYDGHNDKSDNECDSLNIKQEQVSELVVEVDNSVKNDITVSEV